MSQVAEQVPDQVSNLSSGLPALEGPRTYVVTDSVFFHLAQMGDPLATMKRFEVTIEKYDQDNWQACYNINPVYYVDCVCNSSGTELDKVGSFCINYQVHEDSTFELTENEGVNSYFNQAIENADITDLCPDKLKKIKQFLESPEQLSNKLRYHLLNIHRYEGSKIPVDVLSQRTNVYEPIDFRQPDLIMPGDSISREVIGNSGGWEEQLNVYKTRSYNEDMVELQSIHGYKIWDEGMSWKEMGELFVNDQLDFYSIHANNGVVEKHIRTKEESMLVYFVDHSRANTPDMTHILIKKYQLKGFEDLSLK